MRSQRAIGVMLALVITMAAMVACWVRAADYPPPPVPSQEQPEVLTRGPVHEAFAEPVTLENQTGLVVPNEPPPDIQEVPPPQRPEGDNYVWVPGYWSWDPDRNDYLWVSACWRLAPPDRYWVPGYWSPAPGGWEWVPGFWASAQMQEAQEIEYLPAPPAPIDVEPIGPQPDPDTVWVPGCWYWSHGHYVRRAGYWVRQYPDWIWVPSHYRWTPRGYVFVDGHWDYSLGRRGVLFAPVYFPPAIYRARTVYTYSPTICIDTTVLRDCMFVYPRYCHYYFGDYYDEHYVRVGIVPRLYTGRDHVYYDPIYAHERWRFGREDRHWEEHQRQEYERRREDRNLRPAHTYREMEARVARLPEPQRNKVEVAKPLAAVATANTGQVKYEPLRAEDRQRITRQAAQTSRFREERGRWEAGARPNAAAGQRQTTPAPIPERRDTTVGRTPATPTPDERERTAPARGPGVAVPAAGRREPVPEQTTPAPIPERRDTTVGGAPATPTPDERDRTMPTPEPRVTVPPSVRREPVPEQTTPAPTPERRDSTAGRSPTPTPDERNRTAPAPEPRVTVPPTVRREPVPEQTTPAPTPERRDTTSGRAPVRPTPDERERTTPTPEPRVAVPPAGQRETAPDRGDRRGPLASQRESHATQSERVQIPRPPVMASPSAPGSGTGGPPARPADERQDRPDGMDDGQRGDR